MLRTFTLHVDTNDDIKDSRHCARHTLAIRQATANKYYYPETSHTVFVDFTES